MKKQLIVGIVITALVATLVLTYKLLNKDKLFTVMEVPKFELTNQNNQTISEKDMLGKVYVVEFFFANCPTICPVMNQNLKAVEKEINHPDFGVISITIDPKRDTPENLKIHAGHLEITNPNWYFLSGDRDYIYELSKKFNIYVGEDETTAEGLNHSGKFALIDKKGNIRSRFDERGMPILYYSGLNYSDPQGKKESLGGTFHPQVEWIKEDIKKLLNE
ncbi:SCO family protein [Moheibacter sediminis]|uniref:Protein SCO1/2 n=1 Tax=Moheibacter sediminis TaxID=1434700 RepID=A0A1W1ZPD5_9FLAO|nr:SCO family protein [Moheibacter sediminis]SMC50405.1 protein SCO1/2 [Moheibacter sediminis]